MTIDPAVHRALAVESNNSTWEILGREPGDISAADAEEMTRRAYAAAYHWDRAEGATPANFARADWLLARVWAVRGNGPVALEHGMRCLATCDAAGIDDFDRAFAHESIARAHACLGDLASARHHIDMARAVPIVDDEDRVIVEADLASGPWAGSD